MNKLHELNRFMFLLVRDGEEKAVAWAKDAVTAYLRACRDRRAKRGRFFVFRFEYLQSALSFRHILRTQCWKNQHGLALVSGLEAQKAVQNFKITLWYFKFGTLPRACTFVGPYIDSKESK